MEWAKLVDLVPQCPAAALPPDTGPCRAAELVARHPADAIRTNRFSSPRARQRSPGRQPTDHTGKGR
jgi:hypothetical protein